MSDSTIRPGDQIDNQTVILITCFALVAAGCTLDWHCYWLGTAFAIMAFWGIILMLVRYENGKFR